MAVDTQRQRMALLGVGRPFMRARFPSSIDAAARQDIALTYGRGQPPVGSSGFVCAESATIAAPGVTASIGVSYVTASITSPKATATIRAC